MERLRTRVFSALALAAVALLLTWLGGVWFRLLAAGVAAAVFYEWSAISRSDATRGHHMAAAGLLVVFLGFLVFGADAATLIALAVASFALSLVHGLVRGTGVTASVGFAYAALPAFAIAFLRDSDVQGFAATLFLFAAVWATDIFAYFGGRTLGGPKLAPVVSPSKTWSGAISGLVGAVVGGFAVTWVAGALEQPGLVILTAIALSVLSQFGDLFESAFKRKYNVKDSGTLIPGHGGFMDRVDGLIAAVVGFYAIGALRAGLDTPAHAFF